MKKEKIVSALCGDVWCIHPDKLDAICEVINVRLSGGFRSDAEIKAAVAQAKDNVSMTVTPQAAASGGRIDSTGGNVAVLTLYGTLAQRTGAFDSGAVSVERFGKNFDAAIDDPSIGSIVMDIDSPGGSVFGIEEIAEKIYAARGRKKIVAVANSFAASGAYWIAAAADEIVVTSGGEVGSVGVFCLHQDLSGAYAQIGVKHTFIKAGEHKTEGNPFEELDPEAKDYIQERVNKRYGVFTKALAKFRGVNVADVRENFGKGRMKMAKAAVKSSMADAIGTRDSVIDELLKNKNKSFGRRASKRNQAVQLQNKMAAAEIAEASAAAALKVKENSIKRCRELQAAFPKNPKFALSQLVAGATVEEAQSHYAEILAAFPDDANFAQKQLNAGVTVAEAKAAYCDHLAERVDAAKTKAATQDISEGAAAVIFGDTGGSFGGGDFREQAKTRAKDEGITYRQAARQLEKEQPGIHKKYVENLKHKL